MIITALLIVAMLCFLLDFVKVGEPRFKLASFGLFLWMLTLVLGGVLKN
jgi:hypothetical protein